MKICIYLTFDGQTREAFTRYQEVLGGTLQLMTFAEAPASEGFDPQQFGERIIVRPVLEGDMQGPPVLGQAYLGRPG